MTVRELPQRTGVIGVPPVAPVARRRRRVPIGIWFLLPAVILLLLFRVAPVGYAFVYSLTDWNGIGDPQFIGLENYARIFTDPVALTAILNNFWLLLSLPLWIFIPMLIAILIWEGMALGRAIRYALIVPLLLSPAVLGLYYALMLQKFGPVNEFLTFIGLPMLTREWLADTETVVPVFIAIVLWGAIGIGTLMFSAGMASVDESLYDAAEIDGAGFWQRHFAVTLPHLRPVTTFWAIFVLISFFTGMFPLLFTLTNGGPGYASTTIDLYIFQLAYNNGDLGYSTALGLATLILLSGLALVQLRLLNRRQS